MPLTSSSRLGPYEVLEPLGAGGMGEVYRARDPRLDREVAVKVLRSEVASDPDRLRRFEREAKTVAALNHPHILTVHDVGTHEGTPYVVTELLEGETLRQVLKSRSPTQRQVLGFAVQIARGLAAAHDKDIVHRDLKPENVFLTTDGRVKILDFGLAKLTTRETDLRSAETLGAAGAHTTSPGVILGTVAYMSPEQARALPLDPRSDIFSFGVVLYEMLARRHPFLRDTAPATLTAILNDTPPGLVSLGRGIPPALSGIVQRCLEKERENRFRGAHDLALALEAVLQAPSGAALLEQIEERSPYPGLSSFTEKDAGVFFGREGEVKALWEKLRSRRLLAVIGPSGAGKTSFVRAGVLATRPEGWAAIVCVPGRAPMRALARALAPELAGDTEALTQLPDFEELDVAVSLLTKWRRAHDEALVVVDQFEELFTQNLPEAQARFAELIGRLTKDADIHVLLSLRDDFLMRCHAHEPLARVFSELTPLDTLTREGLRRAVTEPAKTQGYAFEDEALVEEMLDAVEEARGALPLLAFTVARLWEMRDRERKLLTREAYDEIGGVAGSLAQHAEQTLERIGLDKEPIVRELFRNLVTAQWTRAAAEREELLSVLPDRDGGARVLDQLIDARLLTSYEVREAEGLTRHPEREAEEGRAKDLAEAPSALARSRHRIEIVHESLLKAWPRLVRWQAQDEEGAALRDQLKQAAHLWEEKGRPDDLLWTGTSEREFELWQDRYSGKLTAVEEEFARAMVHRARQRKRLRRTIAASTLVALLTVLVVIAGLWRRSVAEARRAEGAHLLSLARQRLAEHPTEALAYATASLELADRPELRYVALEALWRGPTEFRFPLDAPYPQMIDFSPDGRWLAAKTSDGGGALWPSDGGPPTRLQESEETLIFRFSPRGDLLAAHLDKGGRKVGLWSVPEGRLLRTFSPGDKGQSFFKVSPHSRMLFTWMGWTEARRSEIEFLLWPVDGGDPLKLARFEVPFESWNVLPDLDPAWSRLAWADGREVHIAPLEGTRLDTSGMTTLEHDEVVTGVFFDEKGRQLATSSDLGRVIRLWSLERDPPALVRTLSTRGLGSMFDEPGFYLRFDSTGSRLAGFRGVLWDLNAAPEAEPLRVQGCSWELAFDPRGRWLATGCAGSVSLWPLARSYPQVLTGHTKSVIRVAFTPDGRRLVSTSNDNSVRLWPLVASAGERSRILQQTKGGLAGFPHLAMAPDGSFVAVGDNAGRVLVLPLDGGSARELRGFSDMVQTVAVGPEGRLVAAGAGFLFPQDAVVRVWDLETGEVRVVDAGDGERIRDPLRFTDAEDLFVWSGNRVRRWDLSGPTPGVVDEFDLSLPRFGGGTIYKDVTPDGRQLVLSKDGRDWIQDLETGATRDLSHVEPGPGGEYRLTLDPSKDLVVSSNGPGAVGVAPVGSSDVHVLARHEGWEAPPCISPDGQWIATGGEDGTIRLWPMPDLSKPPLHTLPREELIAKLKSLTNLRAVADPGSPTGWKIEVGPFPGWEEVPTW